MKQIVFMLTMVLALFHVKTQAQITYNFTNANATGVPTGLTASAVTQVNNNGTTTFIAAGTPASSGYTGATGGNNGNASAKIGAVVTTGTTSTYMQVVLTPAPNRWVNLTAIQWGNFSLATTGPTTLSIYTSLDNYTTPLATANVTHSTTVWTLLNPSFAPVNGLIGTPLTIRIYASAGTGTTPAANAVNWRMDDLKITAAAQGGTAGQLPKYTNQSTFANSVITESASGDIGIGTTTPAAKLDVNGQIKISGGTPGAGKVLTSDASGLATWQTPSGGGGSSQWTSGGGGIYYNTGNVGIGTATPSANLDVAGTIKSNIGMFVLNTYGSFWDISGTHARLWANNVTDALVLSATKVNSQVRIQVNNGARGVVMDGNSKNFLFMGGSGETLSGIGNDNGTGNLAFLYSTAANVQAEGARLTNTGNLLIGTTTNGSNKLDVNGTSVFRGNLTANFGTVNKTAQLRDDGLYISRSSVGDYGNTIVGNDHVMEYGSRSGHRFIVNAINVFNVGESNVGIGTAAPTAQFHTTGSVRFQGITSNNALTNVLVADASGNISFRDASTLGGGSSVWTDGGSGNLYNTTQAGSVCIGLTTIPAGYKLAVAGNIIAEKVKAKLQSSGWPDFVFQDGYKLLSLSEIEQYIKQHNHLPEVPSAEEVGKNGLDLGDNQALLLKKIEELTLHMIEMNKKIENLQTENETLKKTVSSKNK